MHIPVVKPLLAWLVGLLGGGWGHAWGAVLPSGQPTLPTQRTCVRTVCFEMVAIPAGTFVMGSPAMDSTRERDEEPPHSVTLQPFFLGQTEVTQALWQAVMGSNPSVYDTCGPTCPVDSVSWDDVQVFLVQLNRLTGQRYRLPTEAEWEYAARAGSSSRWSWGDDPALAGTYAWFVENSEASTHPVASLQPNAWGLYDMHGNVWERVEDRYHADYQGAPSDGRAWVEGENAGRVLRGGGWSDEVLGTRTAYRDVNGPGLCYRTAGFRLAHRAEDGGGAVTIQRHGHLRSPGR